MDKLLKNIEEHSFSFLPFTSNKLIRDILIGLNIQLSANQQRYVSHLEQNRFSISLKPRQVGETTLTLTYILASFLEGHNMVIMR